MSSLKLGFNLEFNDLYARSGLVKLDALFIKELAESNADLHNKLVAARLDKNESCNLDENFFLYSRRNFR